LFSLTLAITKCKSRQTINEATLGEALLWTIFVQKIYLINKLRVIKNHTIAKIESAKAKKKIDEIAAKNKKNNNLFVGYKDVPDVNLPQSFDATEIAVSVEIIDLYHDLKDNVNEFLNLKSPKNKGLVLYIKLKMEILYLSPLFRRLAII